MYNYIYIYIYIVYRHYKYRVFLKLLIFLQFPATGKDIFHVTLRGPTIRSILFVVYFNTLPIRKLQFRYAANQNHSVEAIYFSNV